MLLQETAWWLSLVFLIGDKLVVGIENALVTINSRIVSNPEVMILPSLHAIPQYLNHLK
jgi:hypothetical protein